MEAVRLVDGLGPFCGGRVGESIGERSPHAAESCDVLLPLLASAVVSNRMESKAFWGAGAPWLGLLGS